VREAERRTMAGADLIISQGMVETRGREEIGEEERRKSSGEEMMMVARRDLNLIERRDHREIEIKGRAGRQTEAREARRGEAVPETLQIPKATAGEEETAAHREDLGTEVGVRFSGR
jgi:hypothetical protein